MNSLEAIHLHRPPTATHAQFNNCFQVVVPPKGFAFMWDFQGAVVIHYSAGVNGTQKTIVSILPKEKLIRILHLM